MPKKKKKNVITVAFTVNNDLVMTSTEERADVLNDHYSTLSRDELQMCQVAAKSC